MDEKQITKAGKMGVTKVNIDTDGRLVWCRVHREQFAIYPENFDLRPPGKVFMAEYAKYIAGQEQGARQRRPARRRAQGSVRSAFGRELEYWASYSATSACS